MPSSQPEPVARAGAIAGAVTAVVLVTGGLLRTLGYLSGDVDVNEVAKQAGNLVLGAGALWAALAPVALALHARSKVTPVESPRDNAGRVLTPVAVDGEVAGPIVEQPARPVPPESAPNPAVDPLPGEITDALRQIDALGRADAAPPAVGQHEAADAPTPTYDALVASFAAASAVTTPMSVPAETAPETRPMRAVQAGLIPAQPTAHSMPAVAG